MPGRVHASGQSTGPARSPGSARGGSPSGLARKTRPGMNGYALTHGWGTIFIAYLLTGIPMLVALIRRRGSLSQLLLLPLSAVPVTLAAALAWTVVRFLMERAGGAMPAGLAAVLGMIFFMLVGYGAGLFISRESPLVHLKRGTHIHDGQGSTGARDGHLSLAGIPVPIEDETKHFKFIGTTGTG